MNNKKSKRKTFDYAKWGIYILIIGILLRFAIAFFIAHPAGDSCWHLSVSRFIAENYQLPFDENLDRTGIFWPAPLFHIISAFFYTLFSVFGASAAEFGLKMVSPLAGAGILILVYMVINKRIGPKIAFFAAVFAAFLPINVYFSTIAYMEALLAFFAMLSFYFALERRYLFSGISAGLAMLTKFNGLFVIPVILFVIYLDYAYNKKLIGNKKKTFFRILSDKSFLKSCSLFFFSAIIIGGIWFVRNYILFGNPFWPFLQNVFGGPAEAALAGGSVATLFSFNHITTAYLGFFGVPDGKLSNLFVMQGSLFNAAVFIWLVGTVVFCIPFLFGMKSLFRKDFFSRSLLALFVFFLICTLMYTVNVGTIPVRFMLPALVVFCVVWAAGIERMYLLFRRQLAFSVFVSILLAVVLVGFSSGEIVKAKVAADKWNFYNADFSWIKENTGKDARIYTSFACMKYNTDRSGFVYAAQTVPEPDSYVFVNPVESPVPAGFKIESSVFNEVYHNKYTGTKIYKVVGVS